MAKRDITSFFSLPFPNKRLKIENKEPLDSNNENSKLICKEVSNSTFLKWKKEHPWLIQEENLMLCTLCKEYAKPEETNFVNGCPALRYETVMGSEKKSVNNKTNLYSEENRKSYSQALNSHLKLGNDNLMVNDKKSSKRLDCESHSVKKGPEKDQNQAYKFNFNSSVKCVTNKTNLHSEENRLTYSQALKSHLKLENYNVTPIGKFSGKNLDHEFPSMKKASERNQNQPCKFNFNSSVNSSPKRKSPEKDKKNKYNEKKLTKSVAMDCEMVGTGPKGESSIIARVSLVNAYGICLYDEFVKPKERVTDFRTSISGVRPSDLKNGKDLFQVQKDVLNIIDGRILVGHSIKHDLDVLFISHPRHLIRDTSLYKPFRELCHGRTPSLKKLTSMILGCEIQSGEHSSIEDAQAAMLLYLRQKKEWEAQVKTQRKRKPRVYENSSFKLN